VHCFRSLQPAWCTRLLLPAGGLVARPASPKPLAGVLRLLKGIQWSTTYVSAPFLGLLKICMEAAVWGRLGSNLTSTDIYKAIVVPIWQSCGKHQPKWSLWTAD
jgi:hypothetical protein